MEPKNSQPEKIKLAPGRLGTFDPFTFLFLVAVGAYFYCLVFTGHFVPIRSYNAGDSLLYIAPGQRLYQGEMIYRDFFEFVTPGTALVHLALFKIFGLRPWIPDVLVIVLGIGMAWSGVAISKRLARPWLAWIPGAALLAGATTYLTDPVHHWYSMLAAMAGVAVLIEERTAARIAAAGALCGVSATFTQTRGVAALVGFAVYLWWESRQRHDGSRRLAKREALLIGGFLLSFFALNGYFIWAAGPARYFWCTVVFVLKYYPKEADWNTFQVFVDLLPKLALTQLAIDRFADWVFYFALTPCVYVLFFARYWMVGSREPVEKWERPMLVAMVGLFLFLSIAPAPNENRMAVSVLPALILLVWFLDSPRKVARVLLSILAALALLVPLRMLAVRWPRPAGIIKTAQGNVAIMSTETYTDYLWVRDHTRPGDSYYQAEFSDQYFYLDLRNATILPRAVNNGYTTIAQVAETIRGLEQHRPRYVFWGMLDPPEVPDWENPSDAHLGPLLDYIHSHYSLVKVFDDSDEVWERKTDSR